MASRLHIPFDNNPALFISKKDSYIVPLGKFSLTNIMPKASTVTVNGVPVTSAQGNPLTLLSSSISMSTSFVTRFTAPSDMYYRNVTMSFTSTDDSGGSPTYTWIILDPVTLQTKWQSQQNLGFNGNTTRLIPYIGPGDLFQVRVSASGYTSASVSLTCAAFDDGPVTLWLKSGDVVATTPNVTSGYGSLILVDEYNAVS
jgi:hypothetical protein